MTEYERLTAAARRQYLTNIEDDERIAVIRSMSPQQRSMMPHHWKLAARMGQIAPHGDWATWLMMAGRGYGKTRAGAEWVRGIAQRDGSARIALMAASLGEARSIMVEGDSGLLAVARDARRPHFEPSRRLLRWPNGAEARLYSAAEPESLRGPQHSHAWCDELAKWDQAGDRARQAWDNLLLGMRLGADPRIMVTTTPRSAALVRRLVDDPSVELSGGRTEDNQGNLSPLFLTAMHRQFGASTLGRQELGGELLEDFDGALWTRALLESCRAAGRTQPLTRVVVGIDPPASARGDACGIVVAGLTGGGSALVLADCSVERPTPERWARAAAEAARVWSADRVIAEANQGGDMVASVLRAADIHLPLRLVHARRGKTARAEPVAALYEAGRVHHAGVFAELEDQLCGLMAGGGYHGPGHSPDRADALVWALHELMLGRQRVPRVLQI